MPKFGLKLWSTNEFYIESAIELYKREMFDYVELFVVPGSRKDYIYLWEKKDFPFFLHAPHFYSGFNLSLNDFELQNRALVKEIEFFRENLKPRWIIFHSGVNGLLEESIKQIKRFKKEFPDVFNLAILENKPKIGLNGEICIGSSPEEIEQLINATGLGLCLDIGHAICYAAWAGIEIVNVLDQFLKLNPVMFHISDGDINSVKDLHLNFGEGNFDLKLIIKKIPSETYISIETKKKQELDLTDFEKDIVYLKKLYY